MGSNYPWQLISGNHDDGDIASYAASCPDKLNSHGAYGTRYYFDYPTQAPLAGFIMITPGVFGTYTSGDPDYTWVSSTIDGARAAGIPWVIVGMHKVCITTGSKSCEIGADLLSYSSPRKST